MAYSVDFKALKGRVGIDDIALSLGYRLNRRAGLGRYIELMLPDGQGGKKDTIVISHPREKGKQTFFRRSDGHNGDVINFILENKSSLGVSGKNDWDIVSQVLCKFANEPLPEYVRRQSESYQNGYTAAVFDPTRYEVHPVAENLSSVQRIFDQRKLNFETVKVFAPYVDLIQDKHYPSKFYNVGFPYKKPGSDKVEGYEIRGVSGFKMKASGTNSRECAWIVDFSKSADPKDIHNVLFAESAFDVMALYQANKEKLADDLDHTVLVSVGGALSRKQVQNIMDHYSEARAVDCFDNDITGRIYGFRLVDAVERLGLNIVKDNDRLRIGYNGNYEENNGKKKLSDIIGNITATAKGKGVEFVLDANTADLTQLSKLFDLKREYGLGKAPANFKDWNDVIMNKPIERKLPPTGYDRLRSLENKRSGGVKM